MTNLGDVVRQLETALCDPRNPPAPDEREKYNAIFLQVCIGAMDPRGSR